jgi:hypothetical protein
MPDEAPITPERTGLPKALLPKALAGTPPKARLALGGVGAVLLLCASIGTVIHPELPPEFASLTRSDEVSSSVGKGPQFCGRSGGRALGHVGSWVVELWIGGHEHCVVVYPKSEREEGLFSSLPTRPSLTAWHTATMVWQVQGPGGMLVDYATRRAEAEAALGHHRTQQAVLLGAGLLACAAGVGLGRRARRSQPSSPVRGPSSRISRGETR